MTLLKTDDFGKPPGMESRRAKPLESHASPATSSGGVFSKRAVLYARVSRGESQDVAGQLSALRSWAATRGWAVVGEHHDQLTGDSQRRQPGDPPGLRAAMRLLESREADVLAVFSADRLVRSPLALLTLVGRVQALGAHVSSFQDGSDLDTLSDHGELFLFLRGWYARMELKLIRARTLAGLERARAAGKVLGRPRSPGPSPTQVQELRTRGLSWAAIARECGCTPTLARARWMESASP